MWRVRGAAPLLVLLVGCSSTASTAVRLADGSWHLTCKSSIGACVQKADQICKEQSFEILRGRSDRKRLGHELGESQVQIDRSELVVRCTGTPGAPKPTPPAPRLERSLAPRRSEGHPVRAPAVTPGPASRVCVKGTTQACVGPGACTGGQVCLDDGSGFGPCDCGSAGPSAPTLDLSRPAPGTR